MVVLASVTEQRSAAPVFEAIRLTKTHAGAAQPANREISLRIEAGEIFGILGDNGAGKTTLVRQMVGLDTPSGGEVRFRGDPVVECEDRLTTDVGYMPQSAFALNNLTVRESLYFAARFRGHGRRGAAAESERLTQAWGLEKVGRRVAKQLSGGERRLLQLAVSMAASPPVLVLDEPTANLDPVNRDRVWDLVKSANRSGATVLFVTHDAREAERVLDRVAVLRGGQLVAIGFPGDLKRELDTRLRLELTWHPDSYPRLPAGAGDAELDAGRWRAVVDKAEAGAMLASVDLCEFTDVRLTSVTLEDLYLHHAALR